MWEAFIVGLTAGFMIGIVLTCLLGFFRSSHKLEDEVEEWRKITKEMNNDLKRVHR